MRLEKLQELKWLKSARRSIMLTKEGCELGLRGPRFTIKVSAGFTTRMRNKSGEDGLPVKQLSLWALHSQFTAELTELQSELWLNLKSDGWYKFSIRISVSRRVGMSMTLTPVVTTEWICIRNPDSRGKCLLRDLVFFLWSMKLEHLTETSKGLTSKFIPSNWFAVVFVCFWLSGDNIFSCFGPPIH